MPRGGRVPYPVPPWLGPEPAGRTGPALPTGTVGRHKREQRQVPAREGGPWDLQ